MTSKVKIQNARLAFPNLFVKDQYDRYGCTLILEPDNPALASIRKETKRLVDEEFKGKNPGSANNCLKSSEEKTDYPGFTKDNYYLNCNRKAAFKPNSLVRRDKTEIESADELYPGCYVNAVVEIWAQNNSYGKKINCGLLGLQFVKDGERFGRGAGSVSEDDFDELPELEDTSAGGSPEDLF